MLVELTQIRSNSILIYYQSDQILSGTFKPHQNSLSTLLHSNTYSGKVTKGSTKRLQKALDIFLQSTPTRRVYNPISKRYQKFRFGFMTLTAPPEIQAVDMKIVKSRMLGSYFDWLRRKEQVRNYIWKAELQKNGSLHFHITLDQFIHHSNVRNRWNELLNRHGILDRFKEEYGHCNPNSTDIHSVKKIKNIEAYLSKYLCKEDPATRKIMGKVWDCSQKLKSTNRFTFHQTYDQYLKLKSLVDQNRLQFHKTDHCIILSGSQSLIRSILTKDQYLEYSNFIRTIRETEPIRTN